MKEKTAWMFGLILALAAGVLGWFIYKSSIVVSGAATQAAAAQGTALGSSAINTLFADILGGSSAQ